MEGWICKPTNWENILPIYNSNDLITSEFDCEINYNEIDGIFVLAGGIDKEGKCHNFVKERLNIAWQIHKLNNKPIFV